MKKLIYLILTSIFLMNITSALTITYYGHACFRIAFDNSYSIIIDPFSSNYPIPKTQANLIISTHEHNDHYNPNFLNTPSELIIGTKNNGKDWVLFNKKIDNIRIWNIPVYHDKTNGSQRGKNSIIVIETEDLKLAHMGDLGHLLTQDELNKLQPLDIAFIPVGGFYTLDIKDVITLIKVLKPKIVIPMHYKTEYTQNWPISSLNDFMVEAEKNFKVIQLKSNTIKIVKEELPKETEIWILNYK